MGQTNAKPTVTIAIPAYNEGANIRNLLTQLLSQSSKNYELLEIIVSSDGSTDNTVNEALSLNNPKIKVLDNTDRQGKIKRVNHIISIAKGDIISFIDADVIPTANNTFDLLVGPIINQNADYVSGKPVPLKPTKFIESAAIVARNVWDKIRKDFMGGESVYTCHVTLYAFKSSFAKRYPFPESVWADIGFHYFICKRDNFKFKPVPNANAFFRAPTKIRDYINQISRYQREDTALFNYFGDWIKPYYKIPFQMIRKYKFEALISNPLQVATIVILNAYSQIHQKSGTNNAKAQWTVINSTKGVLVSNE